MMAMARRVGILTVLTLLVWAAAAWVGERLQGERALAQSTVAMLLCLLTAWATFLLAWSFRNRPGPEQTLAMLGGVGIRMFGVLGAAWVAYMLVRQLQETWFWIWVLIFYLITLALEMTLLAAPQTELAMKLAGNDGTAQERG